MTLERALDCIQLAALGCIGGLGVVRAAMLHARGIRVVVVDRQRTAGQMLCDTALFVALLHEQIRREERFLLDTHGDAYRAYCARVGRYVTWRPMRERPG